MKRSRCMWARLGALLLCLSGLTAYAEGDLKRGAAVFATQCSECHSVKEGKDRKGPSLFAVLGRKSASNSGFDYSDAMKKSGIVWTADRLQAYITSPKKTVPGGKMKYDGLDNAAEMADLLAYLGSTSGH
jgi:cytochrome c